jgi:hypothetical protein
MNLNYLKGKKENITVVVGSSYGASQVGPARSSRPTWPFGPRPRGRGARSHGADRRWPGRIPAVPAMRCSGEGPGSKAVGWWTSFGVAGRKKLTRRMSSARCGRPEGNDSGGQRPGVVVGSSRCGKVVHGGAVLGV